ncbi:unnamed protein product [Discula destructiva]
MAQNADYSLDYYSLNDVFYGRVNAAKPAKKPQTSASKDKTHENSTKHFSFLSFGRHRRSTSSRSSGKPTSDYAPSETSSICS